MRNMANYKQAPILTEDMPKNRGTSYYELPQDIMDIICNELGNSSAQLRVMLVLIGTKPGFAVSEKWMLKRTGLQSASYSKARTALIQKGWLTLDPGKSLKINYKTILNCSNITTEQQPSSKNCSNVTLENSPNTTLEQPSNTVLEQSSNATLGIINKEQNNNKNNITEVAEPESSDVTEPCEQAHPSPDCVESKLSTCPQKAKEKSLQKQIDEEYDRRKKLFIECITNKKEQGTDTEPIPITIEEVKMYQFPVGNIFINTKGIFSYNTKTFQLIK